MKKNVCETYVKHLFKYVCETYGVVFFFICCTYVRKRMLNICLTCEKHMLHIMLCMFRSFGQQYCQCNSRFTVLSVLLGCLTIKVNLLNLYFQSLEVHKYLVSYLKHISCFFHLNSHSECKSGGKPM